MTGERRKGPAEIWGAMWVGVLLIGLGILFYFGEFWPGSLILVGILILIGGIVAVLLLAFKLKGRKDAIPYGTFLAIGPVVALLWGREILYWYISLF